MLAKRPEDLQDLFLAGVQARDVDAIMEIYEPQPVSMSPAGEEIRGRAAMREFYAGFLARMLTLEQTTRRVITVDDLALISNSWRGTVTGPDGNPVAAEGITAEVARRQPDGSWLLVIDDPAFMRP